MCGGVQGVFCVRNGSGQAEKLTSASPCLRHARTLNSSHAHHFVLFAALRSLEHIPHAARLLQRRAQPVRVLREGEQRHVHLVVAAQVEIERKTGKRFIIF